MSKKHELAFEYAKARYGNPGHQETQNEIAKVISCRVGYEAGWDAAIKFVKDLIQNSKPLPPEYSKLVDEYFDELL